MRLAKLGRGVSVVVSVTWVHGELSCLDAYRLVSLMTRRRHSRAAVRSFSSCSTRLRAVSASLARASRSARCWRFAASNAATPCDQFGQVGLFDLGS